MADERWDGVPPFITQARLIDEIAREVASSQPPDGSSVTYEPTILSTVASFAQYVDGPGQARRKVLTSTRADDLSVELREMMYRPGVGTWFSLEMTVSSDGTVSTRFNYDDEPTWRLDPGVVAYVKDLEKFPREVEHQPAWLRAKLAEGRGLESGDFAPQVWSGVRLQASFTVDGSYSGMQAQGPVGPRVWAWADQVAELLTAGGALGSASRR